MTAGGRGSVVTRSRRGMNLTTRGGGMLDRNPVTISTEEDGEEIYLDALSDGNKRTREPERGDSSPHQNISFPIFLFSFFKYSDT